MYIIWVTPVRVGFDLPAQGTWFWVEGVIDLFFYADLVMNFFTAYEVRRRQGPPSQPLDSGQCRPSAAASAAYAPAAQQLPRSELCPAPWLGCLGQRPPPPPGAAPPPLLPPSPPSHAPGEQVSLLDLPRRLQARGPTLPPLPPPLLPPPPPAGLERRAGDGPQAHRQALPAHLVRGRLPGHLSGGVHRGPPRCPWTWPRAWRWCWRWRCAALPCAGAALLRTLLAPCLARTNTGTDTETDTRAEPPAHARSLYPPPHAPPHLYPASCRCGPLRARGRLLCRAGAGAGGHLGLQRPGQLPRHPDR
jgi:hypothetical protein